jgi:hypothetical protein
MISRFEVGELNELFSSVSWPPRANLLPPNSCFMPVARMGAEYRGPLQVGRAKAGGGVGKVDSW